jgi:predicted HicB family RNase H-like nuclease
MTKMGPPVKFKQGTVRINLHLEPRMAKQLKKQAKENGISQNELVRIALKNLLGE